MTKGVIGVDLGGTGIKVAAVSLQGEIVAKEERPTQAEKGANHVLSEIEAAARAAADKAGWNWEQVLGVGLGVPGFVDFETGFVEEAVNLGWKNVPVGEVLGNGFAKPVKLNNDANVAALGEAWVGGGAGKKNVLFVTLGTGVGGGLIIEGNLYSGTNGMAGEIGHIVINPDGELCNCGHRGCLETESSATAIIREANRAVQNGEQTPLRELSKITAKDIFDCAREGDPVSQRIIARMVEHLGFALANLSNTLNPEAIVIGGGLSRAGDVLYKPLQEVFDRFALARVSRAANITPAVLGNDAGVLGAAKLVL